MTTGSVPPSVEEQVVETATEKSAPMLAFSDTTSTKRSKNYKKNAPRRIVKAAHPTKSPLAELVVTNNNHHKITDNNNNNDDDLAAGAISNAIEKKPWESPSVAREIEQEKAASQKQARLASAQDRQRHARDKKVHDRRLVPPQSPEGRTAHTTSSNAAPPKATSSGAGAAAAPAVNPMTRFLSVFSVNSHPHHKRRAVVVGGGGGTSSNHKNNNSAMPLAGGAGGDDELVAKHLDKRLRPSTLLDDELMEQKFDALLSEIKLTGSSGTATSHSDSNPNNNRDSNGDTNYNTINNTNGDTNWMTTSSRMILVASAVAGVAVLVGWILRKKSTV